MKHKLSSSVYNYTPFGGTDILVRNEMSKCVAPTSTNGTRVTAVRLFNTGRQDRLYHL